VVTRTPRRFIKELDPSLLRNELALGTVGPKNLLPRRKRADARRGAASGLWERYVQSEPMYVRFPHDTFTALPLPFGIPALPLSQTGKILGAYGNQDTLRMNSTIHRFTGPPKESEEKPFYFKGRSFDPFSKFQSRAI